MDEVTEAAESDIPEVAEAAKEALEDLAQTGPKRAGGTSALRIDAAAITSDWRTVGGDMRAAMGQHRN